MATQSDRTAGTRAALVAAAVQVLGREGLGGLTHQRLQEVSGHSRGLIGYHFGSREGLLQAVLESVRADFVGDLVDGAHARSLPGLTALQNLVDTYLTELVRAPERNVAVLLLTSASLRERPELRDAVAAVTAGLREGVAGLVARGLADRSVRAGADPQAAAVLVVALLRGITLQWLADRDELDVVRVRHELSDLLDRAYSS